MTRIRLGSSPFELSYLEATVDSLRISDIPQLLREYKTLAAFVLNSRRSLSNESPSWVDQADFLYVDSNFWSGVNDLYSDFALQTKFLKEFLQI